MFVVRPSGRIRCGRAEARTTSLLILSAHLHTGECTEMAGLHVGGTDILPVKVLGRFRLEAFATKEHVAPPPSVVLRAG